MRRAAIERLLPPAYQRAATDGSVLAALLAVMEALHRPGEEVIDGVADLSDPYRTPDAMVVFLAHWVAMDQVLDRPAPDHGDRDLGRGPVAQTIPVGRLRNLVAEGAWLARHRGTADGMQRLLEVATGLAGISVAPAVDEPFHVVVTMPADGADQRELVTRLIRAEKPAATTFQIDWARPPDPEPDAGAPADATPPDAETPDLRSPE